MKKSVVEMVKKAWRLAGKVPVVFLSFKNQIVYRIAKHNLVEWFVVIYEIVSLIP
jgi:hypothetical protein